VRLNPGVTQYLIRYYNPITKEVTPYSSINEISVASSKRVRFNFLNSVDNVKFTKTEIYRSLVNTNAFKLLASININITYYEDNLTSTELNNNITMPKQTIDLSDNIVSVVEYSDDYYTADMATNTILKIDSKNISQKTFNPSFDEFNLSSLF
jgi:hypothetical protein